MFQRGEHEEEAHRHWQDRTYLSNGAGVTWSVPDNIEVVWSGEGEWKITVDVFRDLGIAYGAALLGVLVGFSVLIPFVGAALVTILDPISKGYRDILCYIESSNIARGKCRYPGSWTQGSDRSKDPVSVLTMLDPWIIAWDQVWMV